MLLLLHWGRGRGETDSAAILPWLESRNGSGRHAPKEGGPPPMLLLIAPSSSGLFHLVRSVAAVYLLYSQLRVLGWREEKNVLWDPVSTPPPCPLRCRDEHRAHLVAAISGFIPRPIPNTHSSPLALPTYISRLLLPLFWLILVPAHGGVRSTPNTAF